MTSLEHESNDTSVSASDYGADNWDQENWGDMDVRDNVFYIDFLLISTLYQTSQDPSSPMAATGMSANNIQNIKLVTESDCREGWDNEDWGSLEEEPANEELQEKEADNDINHINISRSDSNSQSHSSQSRGIFNNNTMDELSSTKNSADILVTKQNNISVNFNWDGSNWNDDEFESIEETGKGELESNDIHQESSEISFSLFSKVY